MHVEVGVGEAGDPPEGIVGVGTRVRVSIATSLPDGREVDDAIELPFVDIDIHGTGTVSLAPAVEMYDGHLGFPTSGCIGCPTSEVDLQIFDSDGVLVQTVPHFVEMAPGPPSGPCFAVIQRIDGAQRTLVLRFPE